MWPGEVKSEGEGEYEKSALVFVPRADPAIGCHPPFYLVLWLLVDMFFYLIVVVFAATFFFGI